MPLVHVLAFVKVDLNDHLHHRLVSRFDFREVTLVHENGRMNNRDRQGVPGEADRNIMKRESEEKADVCKKK